MAHHRQQQTASGRHQTAEIPTNAAPASTLVAHEQSTSAPATEIDPAALAQCYNSPALSHAEYEELLEQARTALSKYDLTKDDLAIAADSLARTMHMVLEEHGLDVLAPEQLEEIERDVLTYCGLR